MITGSYCDSMSSSPPASSPDHFSCSSASLQPHLRALEVSKIPNPSQFYAIRYTGEISSWMQKLSFPYWTPENPFRGQRLWMPQHQGLQSSSHRNTQFFSIFAKSPPPTFLPLNVSFGRKQTFQTIISKLFYHTIRKGKLSFPLWEIFVLQTTVVFDTNTVLH